MDRQELYASSKPNSTLIFPPSFRFRPKNREIRDVQIHREEMRHEARENYYRLEEAICRYGPKMRQGLWLQHITRHESGDLAYLNPWAQAAWWKNLCADAVPQLRGDPTLEMVTFIHEPWHTNDRDWGFDVPNIKKFTQNRLGGLNALLAVEFAWFRNVRHGNGHLVAPHVQGLLWGESSRRQRRELARRFKGGIMGSVGVHRQRVYDLPGAIRYSFKAPFYGYSAIRCSDHRFRHKEAELSLRQLYSHWEQFRELSFPDLCFSSGDGRYLLNAARKRWRDGRELKSKPRQGSLGMASVMGSGTISPDL